jgi:hypothetical protein
MIEATLAATQYTRTHPEAARLIGEVYNLEPAQAAAAY